MLIAFSVENYRSFKERVTLSMLAADLRSKPSELDTNNVFQARGDLKLLTSAAIYGANASGKSNLVAALSFMRNLVLNSSRDSRIRQLIGVRPFMLSSTTEHEPSRFEIVFLHQKVFYRYGFVASRGQIEQEWLFQTQSAKEGYLFQRAEGKITVNKRSFKEGVGLEDRTRPNALFLSVTAQWNGQKSVSLSEWFAQLTIDAGLEDSRLSRIAQRFRDSEYQPEIIEFVRKLDLGIDGVQLIEQIDQTERPYYIRTKKDGSEERITMPRAPEIMTTHTAYNAAGEPVGSASFDLETYESQGTRRLFALAEPILTALNNGTVLVIDEIDARLHPLMTCAIIKLFNTPTSNPHHAQLIFTTHDTNLLGSDLLRRDQIWFVEKSTRGESTLYSLVEYRVRNDASYEKNYIQGRYGAIPFIGDLSSLIGDLHVQTHIEAEDQEQAGAGEDDDSQLHAALDGDAG